jgi:hypothetical protein
MPAFNFDSPIPTPLFSKAFEEVLPSMKALPEAEVIPVNLDIPDAVSKVLGLELVLRTLNDRIASKVPETERDLPQKLVSYAFALSHANILYRMAARANDPVPALSEEGMKLRSLLFSDARALIHRGFVDPRALRSYKGSVGYRNLASDLKMLAHLFRSCPESVRDCSAAGDQELQRAEEIATGILGALHRRNAPDPGVRAALDVRNRAFTVFTRGYDQMRRAWKEKDADRVVPSLYAKGRRARKKVDGGEMAAMNDAVGGVGGSNRGGAMRAVYRDNVGV